jgi:hypothetical protein
MHTNLPRRILRIAALFLATALLLPAVLWAFGALWFDGPSRILAVACLLLPLAVPFLTASTRLRLALPALWFLAILLWWLTLKPSHEGPWQADVAKLAHAEIRGDQVVLHNVRHCEYRSELDYTPRWETREVNLSSLTGMDIAINYWGSPWMAHPVICFRFSDAPPVCFSIETRKRPGQSYSALGGLYRRFALIYVVADERDVLLVRTNHRANEDVYLYRLNATPEQTRERFLDYLHGLNQLHQQPRWYHALTANCTTMIRRQRDSSRRAPFDWRMLANGKGDEMLYRQGAIESAGLPFAELKRQSRINDPARTAGPVPGFSQAIRASLPGFSGQ